MSSRTVCISDTHGKDIKELYDSAIYTYDDKIDNIVFLGDYFDNKKVNPDLQIKRFMDLFDLQDNDERIHILIGNHDAKYLDFHEDEYDYPNWNKDQLEKVHTVLIDNLKRLEYAFFDGKYLISHLGITNEFLKNTDLLKEGFNSPLEASIRLNRMLQAKMFNELFYAVGGLKYKHCVCLNFDQFGRLLQDAYIKNQVVGHYDSLGLRYTGGLCVIPEGYMLFSD